MYKDKSMSKINYLPGNEKGSVIVAALMILVLLTIIGFSSINNSTTEQHLATNTLLYERAFYATEAGFEHVKAVLKVPYTQQNQSNIAVGGDGNWTFALNGSGAISQTMAWKTYGELEGDFTGGVVLLQSDLEGISYTVTAWNNDDGGGPASDVDGRMIIRAVATDPRGSTCAIESLIEGRTTGRSRDGYKSQDGAGAGKSYSNNDVESISTFDLQMGRVN
jgi:hypothetical protein